MWQPFLRRGSLIMLFGTLALVNSACSKDESASIPSPTPSQASTPLPSPSPPPKPQVQKPQPANTSDTYSEAIDTASSAVTISQSAVSREDWGLVANRWQDAINLLKTVPASNQNYKNAQQKLSQYQNLLTDAKVRSTPPPPKPKQGDSNPQFFSVPVKGRPGGTPLIEVTFNGKKFDMLFDTGATNTLITLAMAYTLDLKAIGTTQGLVADGAIVELPLAVIESMEINGRVKRKLEVAVAPARMPIGLLGQDFFEGYDIAIKENVIEFRRRAGL
ncbi:MULTISPECIES: retropepsin-like aspartic protease family protein [unclassified Coleofasciculus]|uniref:retropepsin-like aspartic protease family protein n=1 Tax=unclassified Coleofasciculus TaxID=2692782 RepID=UPI001882FADC|nr:MULTISPECIES: retropepsin-like aspartic protease [unclassified Coleofasciculus]MBE9125089.1 retroviral-like aspartic protease family protein [Coleofasciculus sp. LEGE 07081]MBE9150092.1 retroviral-like aspartic protease family protein [Coleofasciculus sp. LEGE 07092]